MRSLTQCTVFATITGLALILLSCGGNKTAADKAFTMDPPEWSRNAVIYEVNLRQFTPEGTLAAFREHLPRLKELGVDILWLMPIHPIGEINRKGSLGSYYSVKDYKAMDPAYGTMEEFRAMVEEAHSLGMYVILDWVANHTAWDNPLMEEHPEWYLRDSTGKVLSPYDWTDVAELDFEQQGLWDYMAGAMEFWVRDYGVDGFRCDVAMMVPQDFWPYAITRLQQVHNVFMLAEAEEVYLHDSAFHMTYAWNLHHLFNRIARGESDADSLRKFVARDLSKFPPDAYRMNFTSNHDENSWNGTEYERLGDAVEVMTVLSYTLPGMPLIYSGQEAGLNRRLSFFDKDSIEWKEHPMRQLYTDLGQLKHRHPALRNGAEGGECEFVEGDAGARYVAFLRKKEGREVLVVANLSPEPVPYQLSFTCKERWAPLGDEQDILLEQLPATLGPWQYYVLEKK
ncbi:MAG TPA: alpha-amylase family glycosyl hydrolase [Bacteroidales bacterium]|nr:alpha-amylase family glycosyl hydrolase [Bacteroidales bacterium]HRZ76151.1 alpha-amylase family glycosyl hydrolase [Bacteroidales bacterium]